MRSVGLDLGTQKSSFCIIEGGRVVERGTVASVDELAAVVGPDTEPARVAFEACREAWHWHATTDWGQTPLIVDTTRVRQDRCGPARSQDRPPRCRGHCVGRRA